jgi:Na+/phosphate symporter
MLFKELLAIFRKDSKLDEAFRLSFEMLEITRDMFLDAKRTLRALETDQIDTDLYKKDKRINKFEKKVRRDVIEHLSIAGTERLASGLTLVSIIIDVERVGDYTKNILELAETHIPRLHAGKNEDDLKRVEIAVEEAFTRVRRMLETSDQTEAQAFIKDYAWLNPLCDNRVRDYVRTRDDSVSACDAVALALYFRYLKRIHSHLRNITTSVFRPFHKLGFVSKKDKRPGQQDTISSDALEN